jgi:hypothetical protein
MILSLEHWRMRAQEESRCRWQWLLWYWRHMGPQSTDHELHLYEAADRLGAILIP